MTLKPQPENTEMNTPIRCAALALIAGTANAEPREIQIRSIDFGAATIEVFRFSATPQNHGRLALLHP